MRDSDVMVIIGDLRINGRLFDWNRFLIDNAERETPKGEVLQ